MKDPLISAALALLVLAILMPQRSAADDLGYKVVARINPGGEGGWDYLTLDAATHRLFIARSTRVQVVDLSKNSLIGEITGTAGVHGVAIAPELGRGFTSNGRDSSVTVFDLKTLAVLSKVKIPARFPDAIVYDRFSRRVFSFNGGSGNATAIDAASGTVAGSVALSGRPEFAVADGRGRMFVNLEDSSAIVSFDSRTLKVLTRWSLSPGEGPTGLAMDREHRRLFAGCRNKKLVVIDADSGRVITDFPIGGGVDAVAFEPSTHLVFSSNGTGTLTMVREDSPEHFSLLGDVPTQPGARTMALDEETHRIYLASALLGEPPPATPDDPHPRAPLVPGSFVILVVGR